MLLKADVKSLEIVAAAELSGDKVLIRELLDKEDTHANNQKAFNLGEGDEGRLIAKRFIFKLLYGATAYGYSTDGDFVSIGLTQKQWQAVIDNFYNKYKGIAAWHKELIHRAQSDGRITIPSGRYFPINPDYTKREPWPLTIIKNYPVQGFGADLVCLARCRASQLIRESGLVALMVSTVHDDIKTDQPNKNVFAIARLINQAVEEVPSMVRKIWKYDFKLPLSCEIKVGMNLGEMQKLVLT